jgi:hypothetical protein
MLYVKCDKIMAKKLLVYFLILLLTAYPASAGEVSLDRWVLNVTLNENGLVDVMVQAELANSGTSTLDGFSFVVPVSATIDNDQSTGVTVDNGTMKFNSPNVKLETVSGGTKIMVSFDKPVEPGKIWDGRIGYKSEKMAIKDNSAYTLTIPVDAPQAVVSGKNIVTSASKDADIRAQVFLPKSYEITSVQPQPFRNLFQYGRMVPTWTPEKLHIGDTIIVKASYSDVLAKIVQNDDRIRILKSSIKEAKDTGKSVPELETYFANANDNNNKAFASFGGKDYAGASQYAVLANDDLVKAENSIKGTPQKETPKATQKSPGFEVYILGFVLLITVLIQKKRRSNDD